MGSIQKRSKLKVHDGSQYLIVDRKNSPVISEFIIREGMPADYAPATAVQTAAFGNTHWPFGDEPLIVAEIDGEVAAYMVWRRTFADEFEILSIATHPRHQRKGLARALIHEFCSAKKGNIFLEVRESNLGAIAFYEALGFRRTGLRHSYYADNSDGAVVMKLEF